MVLKQWGLGVRGKKSRVPFRFRNTAKKVGNLYGTSTFSEQLQKCDALLSPKERAVMSQHFSVYRPPRQTSTTQLEGESPGLKLITYYHYIIYYCAIRKN
jgi:hypothetical protein